MVGNGNGVFVCYGGKRGFIHGHNEMAQRVPHNLFEWERHRLWLPPKTVRRTNLRFAQTKTKGRNEKCPMQSCTSRSVKSALSLPVNTTTSGRKKPTRTQPRYWYGTLQRELPSCTAAPLHLQGRNQSYSIHPVYLIKSYGEKTRVLFENTKYYHIPVNTLSVKNSIIVCT